MHYWYHLAKMGVPVLTCGSWYKTGESVERLIVLWKRLAAVKWTRRASWFTCLSGGIHPWRKGPAFPPQWAITGLGSLLSIQEHDCLGVLRKWFPIFFEINFFPFKNLIRRQKLDFSFSFSNSIARGSGLLPWSIRWREVLRFSPKWRFRILFVYLFWFSL